LSREEGADTALVQRVELSAVIEDVIGQLREMAGERHVRVFVSGRCPQSLSIEPVSSWYWST
jgi:hypothetical protein